MHLSKLRTDFSPLKERYDPTEVLSECEISLQARKNISISQPLILSSLNLEFYVFAYAVPIATERPFVIKVLEQLRALKISLNWFVLVDEIIRELFIQL